MKKGKMNPRRIAVLITALLVFGGAPGQVLASRDAAVMVPANFSRLSEDVGPSVVNIRTVKIIKGGGRVFRQFPMNPRGRGGNDELFNEFFKRFYGNERERNYKQRSLGSGFFIDSKGYIVTNNHVIENADEITVALSNGKEYEAEIIGRDPQTDIAVIKTKSGKDFPALKLGSSKAMEVGEWVVAIGSPFGLAHTVTAGIISAKGRVIGSGPYDDFLQTDASINPGNSGGPLINLEGEVIGINTMIVAGGQGIGFAIPVDLASGIIDQLKNRGEVTRGWLGVTIQDLKEGMAEYYGIEGGEGVFVVDVVKGDPADSAGIRGGDVILSIQGEKVKDARDLTARVALIEVGDEVAVKVMRGGKEKVFKVTVGKRPDAPATGSARELETDELGVTVTPVTPELAARLNLDSKEGIIVSHVVPESRGAQAGFRKGDIILEVNRNKVAAVEDVKRFYEEVKKGRKVSFLVKRPASGIILIQVEK